MLYARILSLPPHELPRGNKEMEGVKKKYVGDGCVLTDNLVAYQILSRLPVKALLRFRTVCRAWHKLISEPNFSARRLTHLKEFNPLPLILIVPLTPGTTKRIDVHGYDLSQTREQQLLHSRLFDRDLYGLMRPQHCNGLILFPSVYQLDLLNLSTREAITLPDASPTVAWLGRDPPCRAALAYIPSHGAFKVAQYFYRALDIRYGRCNVGLEICTLGGGGAAASSSSLSWRVVAEDPPYPIDYDRPFAVGDFIFLKVADSLHRSSPKGFISFNLRDERYREVNLPERYRNRLNYINTVCQFRSSDDWYRFNYVENVCFTELDGKLCFVFGQGQRQDVWISSRDSPSFEWIHSYSIDLPRAPDFLLPIMEARGGRLLFSIDDGVMSAAYYYDPGTKSFEEAVRIECYSSSFRMVMNPTYKVKAYPFGEYSSFHMFPCLESLARIAPTTDD